MRLKKLAGVAVDAMGDQRNSGWAFDILNVNHAAVPGGDVPEPGSLALLALAAAWAARRR